MSTTTADVTITNSNGDYALGYTNFENERLIRQAARIAPSSAYSVKRVLLRTESQATSSNEAEDRGSC